MENQRRNRWGRDEFQVAKTGNIDTRGLYIAMGSILTLVAISFLDINWAETKTQMLFVVYILIIHQAIEQTLGGTDTYLLKMTANQQLILAICS